MKLFKLISICVISVLLVVSITLNVLLLSGFEFVRKDSNEITRPPVVVDTEEDFDITQCPNDDPMNQTYFDSSKELVEEDTVDYLYEDNNIRVTYMGQDKERFERTYLFNIENLSTKTVTVLFTDVYIDGKQVFISGLTCEDLLPETTVTEDFVLSSKDFDQTLKSPTKVTFKIKLVNSKSYLDLYESEQINITL